MLTQRYSILHYYSYIQPADYHEFYLDRVATIRHWRQPQQDYTSRLTQPSLSSVSSDLSFSEQTTMRGLELYETSSQHDDWTMDRMLHRVAVLQKQAKQHRQQCQAQAMGHDETSLSYEQALAETSASLSKSAVARARHLALADEMEVAKQAVQESWFLAQAQRQRDATMRMNTANMMMMMPMSPPPGYYPPFPYSPGSSSSMAGPITVPHLFQHNKVTMKAQQDRQACFNFELLTAKRRRWSSPSAATGYHYPWSSSSSSSLWSLPETVSPSPQRVSPPYSTTTATLASILEAFDKPLPF